MAEPDDHGARDRPHISIDGFREAAQYGAAIMVAHENDDFQVVEQWEAVTEVDVQTPLEVRERSRRLMEGLSGLRA